MSWPRKVMRRAVGSSARAMHFSSVPLPEPFGPIRPWSCPSSTTKSTSPSAASCPNIFVTPRASSSAIGRLARDVAWTPDGDAERAGARPLVQHQADEAARAVQDHDQQQHAEDHGPDRGIRVGEDEAHDLDGEDADEGADQRARAAEQGVEHDLRRQDHSEHDRALHRSEEHTSELQSHHDLVCRLLLEKKKKKNKKKTKNKHKLTQ